jgi:hypothetical protein
MYPPVMLEKNLLHQGFGEKFPRQKITLVHFVHWNHEKEKVKKL